jgi:hypothetical protein
VPEVEEMGRLRGFDVSKRTSNPGDDVIRE